MKISKSSTQNKSGRYDMSNKFASVVLVSRPIQYINAINIPYTNSARTLLIVNSFKSAHALKEMVSRPESGWTNVLIFDSVEEALIWVRKNKGGFTDFFTFSDFGLRLCMMLGRLKPLRIHVFEEGAGTYTREELTLGSLRFIASILSTGKIKTFRHMGDCRFVDTIFVNHINLYRTLFPGYRKPVRSFSVPFLEHLKANSEPPNFARILPEDAVTHDALLYLSDWTVNEEVLDILASHPFHVTIAKAHPAYSGSFRFKDVFDFVVESESLAEIIIAELASRFKSLTVVHECSSAVLHCRLADIDFEEINLGSSEIGLEAKFRFVQSAVNRVKMCKPTGTNISNNYRDSHEDSSRYF